MERAYHPATPPPLRHYETYWDAMQQQQTLSSIIEQIFDPASGPSTFGQLIDEIDQHGMAVILIFFALPSALPLPAAGYSTVLSIPLFVIGFRLICGYHTLWLPNKLRQRPFHPEQFSRKLVNGMLQLIHFVERFSKPRFVAFARSQVTRMAVGLLIIALACSMLLPIPGTNTAPAFGIFLIGFALLEEDGILLLVGMLASVVALSISLTIIFFGYKTLVLIKESVRGLLQ